MTKCTLLSFILSRCFQKVILHAWKYSSPLPLLQFQLSEKKEKADYSSTSTSFLVWSTQTFINEKDRLSTRKNFHSFSLKFLNQSFFIKTKLYLIISTGKPYLVSISSDYHEKVMRTLSFWKKKFLRKDDLILVPFLSWKHIFMTWGEKKTKKNRRKTKQ